MDKKIFCVIPALNEENNISQVIRKVKPFVHTIVVVNDGSFDKTEEIAAKEGAIVISHVVNRGQGAALETGNTYSLREGADIIVHFDADGQFLAEEISEVVKPIIEERYDVILGSRFLGKETNMPFSKKYLLFPLARFVNKIMFGVIMTDPQCGFRAMSNKSAKIITIEQDGWAHCTEILAKVLKSNLKFKEVPVTVIYNQFGRNLRSGVQIIRDLLIAKFIN